MYLLVRFTRATSGFMSSQASIAHVKTISVGFPTEYCSPKATHPDAMKQKRYSIV